MRVHCKPGASGQKGILWPLGFLWVQLGGPGPLVAWEEIQFLSSKGFQLHPSAKRRKNIARLLFLGVKETERPDILGGISPFPQCPVEVELPDVGSNFFPGNLLCSASSPNHPRPLMCEIGDQHPYGWNNRRDHCGLLGGR